MDEPCEPRRSPGLTVCLRQDGPIAIDVDFTCAAGEVLALVGPSGAGKTTVLRSIAGLVEMREGRITVAGETWFDSARSINLTPQSRHVGLVFQDYALFPHLTAEDNVALALGRRPAAASRDEARRLLASVNLDGLGARRPHQLSGGQKQRVALARALARSPRVLLLDEPFSAVDHITRERLKRELAILRRSLSIPMVLVTHDLGEAAALADRIAVLYHGRQLALAPAVELLTRPPTATVARLIGHQNIFDAVVVQGDGADRGTLLDWHGIALQSVMPTAFACGRRVSIAVPADSVVVLRPGEETKRAMQNVVRGQIEETVLLGDHASVAIRVADIEHALLAKVSMRAMSRLSLAPGQQIAVSITPEAIAIMDPAG